MPNVITIRKPRRMKINRSPKGEAIIRIDPEAADLIEKLLAETGGEFSVRDLSSALIKYAANNTIIKIEEESEEEQ